MASNLRQIFNLKGALNFPANNEHDIIFLVFNTNGLVHNDISVCYFTEMSQSWRFALKSLIHDQNKF